jgi:hypothetical protein
LLRLWTPTILIFTLHVSVFKIQVSKRTTNIRRAGNLFFQIRRMYFNSFKKTRKIARKQGKKL